jgi:predicted MFS family arabinose efflux permease
LQPESKQSRPGGERRIPERRVEPWSAFRYRDYRLIFTGQVFSNLGQWMQFTSLTYLLGVMLAPSSAQASLHLGFLGAAQAIPSLLCSPIAGYVADRYPRRRTLFIVGIGRASAALGMAMVTQFNAPWVMPAALLLAAIFAAVQAFDFPTRQSWVPHLVPPRVLSNAVGLMGVGNNMPLMIGPAIAGLLIGTVGVYTSFYVQAATQVVVVILIASMRPVPASNTSREPMLQQITEGLRFVASHAVLKWVVLLLVVLSFLVRPFNLLLAGFAGHVLRVDAKAYGTMLALVGIGTFTGALMTAVWQSERRAGLFVGSGVLISVMLVLLSVSREFAVVLVVLAVMGFGQMSFSNTSVYIVQVLADPAMRGRALSLLSMIVLGVIPAGALVLGALASLIGLPATYALGGAIGLAFSAWIWFAHPTVRRA